MFAFTGSHRSGKTTLARDVAGRLGLFFHETSVSRLMQERGINMVEDMSIEKRLEAQEILLEAFAEQLNDIPSPFVSDRCPIDMIAYTLAEVGMHDSSKELGERIQAYTDHALEITAMHYDLIVVTRPLPSYEEDPTKPPMNPAYQSHIQFIIEGAAHSIERATRSLQNDVTTAYLRSHFHEERLEACCELFQNHMEKLSIASYTSTFH